MGKVIITSIFLGIGLAMDACAVSMANGLKENKMKFSKTLFIAFMFGLFQGAMPLIGYLVGSQVLTKIGATEEIAEENACRFEHAITPELLSVMKNFLDN